MLKTIFWATPCASITVSPALPSSTKGMYALEAAFGYCPDRAHCRISGINWSPGLVNPFRSLGRGYGEDSLDAILVDQYAGLAEPLVFALHLAAPRLAFTDKAKSALVLPPPVVTELVNLVEGVTKRWARVRKAEERDASAEARRLDRGWCGALGKVSKRWLTT
jgi:hypothetical protein